MRPGSASPPSPSRRIEEKDLASLVETPVASLRELIDAAQKGPDPVHLEADDLKALGKKTLLRKCEMRSFYLHTFR